MLRGQTWPDARIFNVDFYGAMKKISRPLLCKIIDTQQGIGDSYGNLISEFQVKWLNLRPRFHHMITKSRKIYSKGSLLIMHIYRWRKLNIYDASCLTILFFFFFFFGLTTSGMRVPEENSCNSNLFRCYLRRPINTETSFVRRKT